eukprot:1177371-Prorocentrum_minimum.AAC.4
MSLRYGGLTLTLAPSSVLVLFRGGTGVHPGHFPEPSDLEADAERPVEAELDVHVAKGFVPAGHEADVCRLVQRRGHAVEVRPHKQALWVDLLQRRQLLRRVHAVVVHHRAHHHLQTEGGGQEGVRRGFNG